MAKPNYITKSKSAHTFDVEVADALLVHVDQCLKALSGQLLYQPPVPPCCNLLIQKLAQTVTKWIT
jgi:hypothetical protein